MAATRPAAANWAERVAVVTGASSGIGAAVARACAERGATVVGVARRAPRLAALVESLQASAPGSSFIAGDLAEPGFPGRVIEQVLARHGRLDLLVNNAGIPVRAHIYDTPYADVEHALRVNFLAAVEATLAALPAMVTRGSGHVINISSFAATVVPPREAVYSASKAAMNAFSEGLWHDLLGSGVHVACLHLGPFDTEIWEHGEAPGYRGRRHPPERAAQAVLRAIDRRQREVLVPRWDPMLHLARWLRRVAPRTLLRGVARMDPISPDVHERLRRRVREAPRPGPP